MNNKYDAFIKCCFGNDIQKLKDEISALEDVELQLSNILIHPESKATPLHIACQRNKLDFVELLLKHGAQVNAPTIDGTTPLMIACENGNMELVNILLKQDEILLDQMDNSGNTSLSIAAQENHDDIVFILMDAGSDISHCQNHRGKMAIQSKIVPYHMYRKEKSEQKSNEELLHLFQDVLNTVKENNESLRNLVRK